MQEKVSRYVFQLALALILGYFGFLAVSDPVLQAAVWIPGRISAIIGAVMPIALFVQMFGSVQILAAIMLAIDKFTQIALPVVALMLIGIIINLGPNDIAFRDAVILAGVVFLYFSKKQHAGEAD